MCNARMKLLEWFANVRIILILSSLCFVIPSIEPIDTPAMICQSSLGRSLWEIPQGHYCKVIHTKELTPVPLTLELMRRNILKYHSYGHYCTKVRTTVNTFSNFLGTKYKEVYHTDLAVSIAECNNMVEGKRCDAGQLTKQGGDMISTDNKPDIRYPWLTHRSVDVDNCFMVPIKVFMKHGDTVMTSTAPASAAGCMYNQGSCQLKNKAAMIWTPNTTVQCEYVPWKSMKGARAGSSWVNSDHTMALTWDDKLNKPGPGRPTFTDCKRTLLRSHQGIVFQDSTEFLESAALNITDYKQQGWACSNLFCTKMQNTGRCKDSSPQDHLAHALHDATDKSVQTFIDHTHESAIPSRFFVEDKDCSSMQTIVTYNTHADTKKKWEKKCFVANSTESNVQLPWLCFHSVNTSFSHRRRREPGEEEPGEGGPVSNVQLSASMQALYNIVKGELGVVYRQALMTTCNTMNTAMDLVKVHITASPTLSVRSLLKRSLIWARASSEVLEVWPCNHIPLVDITFLKQDKICTREVPVNYQYHNKTRKGYLDPVTNIIIDSSTPHSCSLDHELPLKIDGKVYLYHGADGELTNGLKPSKLGMLSVQFNDSLPSSVERVIFKAIPVMYSWSDLDQDVSLNDLLSSMNQQREIMKSLGMDTLEMTDANIADTYSSKIMNKGFANIFLGFIPALSLFHIWVVICCLWITINMVYFCLKCTPCVHTTTQFLETRHPRVARIIHLSYPYKKTQTAVGKRDKVIEDEVIEDEVVVED